MHINVKTYKQILSEKWLFSIISPEQRGMAEWSTCKAEDLQFSSLLLCKSFVAWVFGTAATSYSVYPSCIKLHQYLCTILKDKRPISLISAMACFSGHTMQISPISILAMPYSHLLWLCYRHEAKPMQVMFDQDYAGNSSLNHSSTQKRRPRCSWYAAPAQCSSSPLYWGQISDILGCAAPPIAATHSPPGTQPVLLALKWSCTSGGI